MLYLQTTTGSPVEPVQKDNLIGHKKFGLSRQVVFGDRCNVIEM